jgi:hypothetical protein
VSALLRGDLSGLALPGDLAQLRTAIGRAETAAALGPLYAILVSQHPVAMLDLVIGPRAATSAAAVQAALAVVHKLEQHAPPAAIYKRLLEVNVDTRAEVILAAAQFHPAAGWLVQLSDLAEDVPGVIHLRSCAPHPAFPAICWAHARAGHLDALVTTAEMGRAEPSAALLSVGRSELAITAATRALHAAPNSPVVAYLAAVGGVHIEDLLLQLVPRLKSAQAGAALKRSLVPFPRATRLLAAALPGMR